MAERRNSARTGAVGRRTALAVAVALCLTLPRLQAQTTNRRTPDTPAVMGMYQGEWISPSEANRYLQQNPALAAVVAGTGENRFLIRFLAEHFKRADILMETHATLSEGRLEFSQNGWQGTVDAGGIRGRATYGGTEPVDFALKKYLHESPSLGAQPPKDAVILFDGSGLDAWEMESGHDTMLWKVVDGKYFEVVSRTPEVKRVGGIRSRKTFSDVRLHVEFRLPYQPERGGQGRANSGVFLQEAYEVQVLDSFGSDGLWRECGALYKVSPPKVNACLPPGQWQTYDITFRAARFDARGRVTSYPTMSVKHNGIPIHTNQILRERTQNTQAGREKPPVSHPSPISLQDHGHPIQFRNVWAVPD